MNRSLSSFPLEFAESKAPEGLPVGPAAQILNRRRGFKDVLLEKRVNSFLSSYENDLKAKASIRKIDKKSGYSRFIPSKLKVPALFKTTG